MRRPTPNFADSRERIANDLLSAGCQLIARAVLMGIADPPATADSPSDEAEASADSATAEECPARQASLIRGAALAIRARAAHQRAEQERTRAEYEAREKQIEGRLSDAHALLTSAGLPADSFELKPVVGSIPPGGMFCAAMCGDITLLCRRGEGRPTLWLAGDGCDWEVTDLASLGAGLAAEEEAARASGRCPVPFADA